MIVIRLDTAGDVATIQLVNRHGIHREFDMPDEAFMVADACGRAPAGGGGIVRYQPAFAAV